MCRREEWMVGSWCLNRDGVVVLFGTADLFGE